MEQSEFQAAFAELYGPRALLALGAELGEETIFGAGTGPENAPVALLERDGLPLAICYVAGRWCVATQRDPDPRWVAQRLLGTAAQLIGRPPDDRWDDLLACLDETVAAARSEE
ncbi:MAG: hypothetical protein OHK0022_28040 [Roseiflexaceae bacterium]